MFFIRTGKRRPALYILLLLTKNGRFFFVFFLFCFVFLHPASTTAVCAESEWRRVAFFISLAGRFPQISGIEIKARVATIVDVVWAVGYKVQSDRDDSRFSLPANINVLIPCRTDLYSIYTRISQSTIICPAQPLILVFKKKQKTKKLKLIRRDILQFRTANKLFV